MRAKNWSILAVWAVATLLLGGYAAVAWTAPGLQPATGAAEPTVPSAVSDGIATDSKGPAVCPAAGFPGVTASQSSLPDLACPQTCTTDAQCNVPECCGGEGAVCFTNRCFCT